MYHLSFVFYHRVFFLTKSDNDRRWLLCALYFFTHLLSVLLLNWWQYHTMENYTQLITHVNHPSYYCQFSLPLIFHFTASSSSSLSRSRKLRIKFLIFHLEWLFQDSQERIIVRIGEKIFVERFIEKKNWNSILMSTIWMKASRYFFFLGIKLFFAIDKSLGTSLVLWMIKFMTTPTHYLLHYTCKSLSQRVDD